MDGKTTTAPTTVETPNRAERRRMKREHVFGCPLLESDFAALECCAILRQHAEDMCRRVDSTTGAEMFGQDGIRDCAGIVFLISWPGQDHVREYVLRRDNPEIENGKPRRKYLFPPGRSNILLFPPQAAPEWLDDTTLPIIFVEGPKKLLALWNLAWHSLPDSAQQPRFLPIAVSGVWNFRGRIGKETNEHGERVDETGLICDFNRITFIGRETTIWYDRNVHDNPERKGSVNHARNSFAKELRQLGASVRYCDLPADDLSINGPDDYTGKYGPDAALELYSRRYDPKAKKKSDSNSEQPLKTIIHEIPSVHDYASEKVEFLVPGLIPKGTVTVISGESEAGKTTLTLAIAGAIARGGEVFGQRCEQHPVLLLTRENPSSYISDITRRLGIPDGPDTNLYIWGDWLEEQPPAPASSHVLVWVSQCEPSPLVVVDSLIAFFDGDNENDSAQMRAFLNQGRKLIQVGACGVIFLHHPGKADTAKDYRGSSDLKPAIDTGYKLTNSGDGKLDRLYLKAFKARFTQQQREMVLLYTESDGKASFIRDERPNAVAETNDQILANLLEQNPGIATGEFERAAVTRGVTQVRARRYLEAGVKCGKILVDDGPHNKKCHRLAPRQPQPVQ